MSGSTPVQFVKAATKEGRRMATNEEKDAAALQGVAAAFGSAPTMWPTSTSSIECTARVTFFLFDFALRLMDPPCCTMPLLQHRGTTT